MIRAIQGPWVELSFYSHKEPETETFAGLIRFLLGLGASPTGEAYACDAEYYKSTPYASLYDLRFVSQPVGSASQLIDIIRAVKD
jgi:hypothetical protein